MTETRSAGGDALKHIVEEILGLLGDGRALCTLINEGFESHMVC